MIRTKRTALFKNSVYNFGFEYSICIISLTIKENIRKAFVNVNMYIFEIATLINFLTKLFLKRILLTVLRTAEIHVYVEMGILHWATNHYP